MVIDGKLAKPKGFGMVGRFKIIVPKVLKDPEKTLLQKQKKLIFML